MRIVTATDENESQRYFLGPPSGEGDSSPDFPLFMTFFEGGAVPVPVRVKNGESD